MTNDTKLIEKEKVKLLAALVLVLLGVGVAFEFERASRPKAEVVVAFYDNKEGNTELSFQKKVDDFQKKAGLPTEQKVGATPEQADEFFHYLGEIDDRLSEIEKRETVLDKIETLKPKNDDVAENRAFEKAEIEVYDNTGEVVENKVDEAAEEEAVLKAVEGDEAEKKEGTLEDTVDEASEEEAVLKAVEGDEAEKKEGTLEDKVDEAAGEEVLKAVEGDEAEKKEGTLEDKVDEAAGEAVLETVEGDEATVQNVLATETKDAKKESSILSEHIENKGENLYKGEAIDMMKAIIEREKAGNEEK